jgi:hypothetical protein
VGLSSQQPERHSTPLKAGRFLCPAFKWLWRPFRIESWTGLFSSASLDRFGMNKICFLINKTVEASHSNPGHDVRVSNGSKPGRIRKPSKVESETRTRSGFRRGTVSRGTLK